MKNILKILCFTLILGSMLTGCGPGTKPNVPKEKIANETQWLLTPQEWSMVRVYHTKRDISNYNRVFLSIQGLRTTENPKNADAPFCDVVGILESVEKPDWDSLKTGESILAQWAIIKGEDLRVSCEKMKGIYVEPDPIHVTQQDINHEDVKNQVVEDTITINGETLLSSEKIRELTLAAKRCGRAKDKLLEITENRRYLNLNDYETINKLILDCDMLFLETELNN